jgi:probable DNA metabolism protein
MFIYIFDGSFEGLLSAVFEWFERRPGPVLLRTETRFQPDAFTPSLYIYSDPKKAERVWTGLQQKLSKTWLRRFYCTYLSELDMAYSALFEFTCYLFSEPAASTENYGNPHVLALSQTARKVEREKHRMEAFIRFRHTADDIFYCGIDPDFNVLPLIAGHFTNRYADQKWVIYDLKRGFGLYYNLEKTEEIKIDFAKKETAARPAAASLSAKEELYALLWKDYFKSANIPARKNTRLHIQHVPKRYWKYLTEK